MKEININIEGYNVNGICVGCLNYNRKMFYNNDIKNCLKLLADIDVQDGLDVQMCWECLAHVRTVKQFQEQLLRSYDVLIDYSTKQTFLNCPSDFTQYATETLSTKPTVTLDIIDPKGECQDNIEVNVEAVKDEHEKAWKQLDLEEDDAEIKEEMSAFPEFDDVQAGMTLEDTAINTGRDTSDDDVMLSNLKKRKEKKKKEKKRKGRKKVSDNETPEESKNKRLKHLPEDLVERITVSEEEMMRIREKDRDDKSFTKMKYKCEQCILAFNTEKLMQDHMAGKHTSKSPSALQCDICACYLLTREHFSRHRAGHLVAYSCRACPHVTSSRRRAALHAHAHSGGHDCADCGASFDTKSKLSYHRGVCRQQKPQCDCCGRVFANKMTLKYHLKILTKTDKPEKEKLYLPCKGCNKVFHSKKSYRAHVVIHDGVTYPCSVCGKPFQWKRNLARHMRNHRDKDNGAVHECRECGKKFSSKDCLNNHMRLSRKHVKESNYNHECSYCGKKFASRWCMVDHVDWEHLKNIKYQCSFCFKAFKTGKILVAHVSNIHEGKRSKEPESEHLCEICGKSYKSVRRLKGHVWAMHTSRASNKTYRCKLCPAAFTWQTSVYKHVKMMHQGSNSLKRPRIAPPVKKGSESYTSDLELANRIQYYQQNISSTGVASQPVTMNLVPNMQANIHCE